MYINEEINFNIRVKREVSKLSKKEKAICDYIKIHSKDVIHMAISELAEFSNASEASLVRLSKKLGYKGFQAMKINIAQDIIDPSKQISEVLTEADNIPSVVTKVFHSNIQALRDTLLVLDKKSVEEAIELLIKAKNIFFVGIGGSNIIAQDAQHKFMRIGFMALSFSDTTMQTIFATNLQENDVVIPISHSGASRDTIEIVKQSKNSGAKIISITDYCRCPLIKYSDISLFTSSSETAFKTEALSSRIAELTIIDALFIGCAYKQHDKALTNMKKTREALDSKKI